MVVIRGSNNSTVGKQVFGSPKVRQVGFLPLSETILRINRALLSCDGGCFNGPPTWTMGVCDALANPQKGYPQKKFFHLGDFV
jgi:hypothetical protein